MGLVEDNVYHNMFGKKREVESDAPEQSRLRLEAWEDAVPEILQRLETKGIHHVRFEVSGSVKVGAATEASDIDILIAAYQASGKEESVVVAMIRQEIYAVCQEINFPYHINVFIKGQPIDNALHLHVALENLKRQKK